MSGSADEEGVERHGRGGSAPLPLLLLTCANPAAAPAMKPCIGVQCRPLVEAIAEVVGPSSVVLVLAAGFEVLTPWSLSVAP